MNDFLKMDIFFIITTIAVIILSSFSVIVLWRLSRVLKNVDHISEQVSLETDAIRTDIAEVRSDIHEGKSKLKSIMGFFDKQKEKASKKT